MPDIFTREKRSEVMSLIRSRGNKDTEMRLVSLMREQRITGWRRQLQLRVVIDGKAKRVRPDFVFRQPRVVVFVDGCFWHGCPKCYVRPKQHRKFWDNKVETNQARDRQQNRALKALGWRVLRIWECGLTKHSAPRTMRRLQRLLTNQK
jgi:DNA mismatch endonuclease (patch repair protein)